MSSVLEAVPLGGGVEMTLAEGEHCVGVCEGRQEGGEGRGAAVITDVALLAAGTGITPMVAVILEAVAAGRWGRG